MSSTYGKTIYLAYDKTCWLSTNRILLWGVVLGRSLYGTLMGVTHQVRITSILLGVRLTRTIESTMGVRLVFFLLVCLGGDYSRLALGLCYFYSSNLGD